MGHTALVTAFLLPMLFCNGFLVELSNFKANIEQNEEKGVEHITLEMEWIVGFSYVPCLTSMSVGWPVFPTLLVISVFRDITWDEEEALCLVTGTRASWVFTFYFMFRRKYDAFHIDLRGPQ